MQKLLHIGTLLCQLVLVLPHSQTINTFAQLDLQISLTILTSHKITLPLANKSHCCGFTMIYTLFSTGHPKPAIRVSACVCGRTQGCYVRLVSCLDSKTPFVQTISLVPRHKTSSVGMYMCYIVLCVCMHSMCAILTQLHRQQVKA